MLNINPDRLLYQYYLVNPPLPKKNWVERTKFFVVQANHGSQGNPKGSCSVIRNGARIRWVLGHASIENFEELKRCKNNLSVEFSAALLITLQDLI